MANKTQIGRVTKVEAIHYQRRAFRREHVKISLWAETDLGHKVWLCKTGCDTRRIETKVREFENEYSFLIGQEIKYTLKIDPYALGQTGFLRPRGTTPEYYRPRIESNELKGGNENNGRIMQQL